jgi:ATP-binding cassette, subfamily F, member 3
MISASHLSMQFSGTYLFKDVSLRVGPRDRIGLVGSNGAGKSTLLKILAGGIVAEGGTVSRARYVTVGYLPQEGMAVAGRSLYAEAESAFGDILETQARLDQLHRAMAETDPSAEDFPELLAQAGELQHKLEASDAFRMKTNIEKVLMGLGFRTTDMERLTEEFSGGWQMRIALAKLLLQEPSLLLLDEPTNHLDLDSLEWLEEYIRGYEGAVMIVSHDRRFLDNMTTRIWELSLGNLAEYTGNFSAYVRERDVRREHTLSAWKNQQQQIKQTERFIERFRYKATKARQVQSRIKQLDKLDIIELEDEENEIRFRFPPAPHSGAVMMHLKGIDKSYGPLSVFRSLDFSVDRADRMAFVGVNGAGKSTLSRIIAGSEPIDRGERRPGHQVVISYYAQHQAEELNATFDVLQTVETVATGEVRKHLRSLLGCFLFSGDDVFKKVSVLSGGEKSRLALAKMLLSPANLLVLDEPTNHLDMRSKGVLQEALAGFEGSYIIVSHDRDFLDPIVNKVVEFRDGRVKVYPGNITEYDDTRRRAAAEAQARNAGRPVKDSAAVPEKERKRLEAEQRQRRYTKTKPLREKIAKLEREIEKMENEKSLIEQEMADPTLYRDGEHARSLNVRYRELETQLPDRYFQWGKLSEELERANDDGTPESSPS